MSWICPDCETENSNGLKECEVCNSPKTTTLLETSLTDTKGSYPRKNEKATTKAFFTKQSLTLTTRYYISGRSGSYLGGDILYMDLPKGTLIRKMLTYDWIPIESFNLPTPHISETTDYYAWGMKGVYNISQLRKMHLPKSHLIREVLTEQWFPIGE